MNPEQDSSPGFRALREAFLLVHLGPCWSVSFVVSKGVISPSAAAAGIRPGYW